MSLRNRFVYIMLGLLALGIAVFGIPAVNAQDPTIPTRTPTPGPGQPPPDPTDVPGGPGNPPPPPAATEPSNPPPGTSPTSTAPGGNPFLPTATTTSPTSPGTNPPAVTVAPGATGQSGSLAPPGGVVLGTCDETPYIQAIGLVVVFGGPGKDYEEVAELGPEEMRPVIGRAYYAQWWQIQIDPDTVGWVPDVEVNEYGNTALVPLVEAPPIYGNTPTPGAIWNPTPLPLLTCVPTPTPTNTPTATMIASSSTNAGAGISGNEGGDPESQEAAPTAEMVSADVGSSAPAVQGESDSTGLGVNSRDGETSRASSPTNATNLILPLGGLALISGGIILALLARSQSGPKTRNSEQQE